MNRRLIRHFLLQAILLGICFGSLGYLLIQSRHVVNNTNEWVDHSRTVISEIQNLDTTLERMLADQRGYQLSGDSGLRQDYQQSKDNIDSLLGDLEKEVADNSQQAERVRSFKGHFERFSKILGNKNKQYSFSPGDRPNDTAMISSLKDALVLIDKEILGQEYRLLDQRMQTLQAEREHFFGALLAGGVLSVVLLFVFNGLMFAAQQERARAELRLEESEATFRLAVEGTQDGVYDWNLVTGKAVYGPRFWAMLGYEPGELPATVGSFNSLLRPDDRQQFEREIRQAAEARMPGYAAVFMMQHKTGRWLWINSRGRILYGADGKPTRIVGAQTDISDIKTYEKRLESEKERAEKANRAKSEFLAHMSHEIRTPLTAVSGIAEILTRNQKNLDEKQKLLVKTLRSSSSLLSELINDVLDFSRIESGELRLEDVAFDLSELFEQVIDIAAPTAREKNIGFAVDYEAVAGLQFSGDRMRLRQILINLVGNAIKFTAEGSVRLTANRINENGHDRLRIDVVDTGIGIEPAKFEMVFEQFKQGDSSISRKYGGSGLGLAISLRLAQMMSGTILLDSAPGKGSTFSLIIPFRTGEAGAVNGDGKWTELIEKLKNAAPGGKRILLAEDYEGNVVMLGYILDSLGCQYDVAHTGREALTLWESNHYDLILMDVQMPDMDGLTATGMIRQQERARALPRVPVIGMTAHVRAEDREKCFDAGMDVYLPKPVVEADLKTAIAECLMQERRAA